MVQVVVARAELDLHPVKQNHLVDRTVRDCLEDSVVRERSSWEKEGAAGSLEDNHQDDSQLDADQEKTVDAADSKALGMHCRAVVVANMDSRHEVWQDAGYQRQIGDHAVVKAFVVSLGMAEI